MSSGQKAKTLLELLLGRYVALHNSLEFVAGVKSDHISRLDRDRFAGSRVAPRAWRLSADVEIAETRHLHVVARNQRGMNQIEEGLDHVFRLALVETQALEQKLGQLCLGERGRLQRRQHHEVRRRLVAFGRKLWRVVGEAHRISLAAARRGAGPMWRARP